MKSRPLGPFQMIQRTDWAIFFERYVTGERVLPVPRELTVNWPIRLSFIFWREKWDRKRNEFRFHF